MKQAKDDQYYLLIPDPFTGEQKEFDIDRKSNVGLAMRLIRKRKSITEDMKDNFDRLQDIRDENNISQVEDEFQEVSEELSQLDPDEYETDEDWEEEINSYEAQLENLQNQFPKELEDLQNKTSDQMDNIDRLGIKICVLILQPVNGIPDEYSNKKEYFEEIVGGHQDIEDIIAFFLSTLNSTTKSLKEGGIQMKKRNGHPEKTQM